MVARRKPSDGCGKTTRPLRPPLPFLSRKEIQTGFVHLFETNMVRSRPPARHFINQRGPPSSPRPAGCPARIGSPGAPSPLRAATCPSAAPNPAAGRVWPSLARSLTRPTWPWPLPAASPAACHTEIFLGHVCRCVHPTLSWDESRALDRVKYFEIKATCAYVRVGIYLLKCSKRRPKGCTLDLKCKRVSPCRVEPLAALHGCPRWENLSGGTFSFLFIHFCIVRIFFFYHEYILHFYNQEEL